MRVLVTGGAGFIGSHLVDRLLTDGHLVDIADNLSTGSLDNLAAAFQTRRCNAINADITQRGFTDWVRSRHPDVVWHLAAQIDVRDSVAQPLRDARVNVLGTLNVLEAARQAGARKVVNVSSVAIYGPPEQLPVTDATLTNPLSPYAVSKLAAETYCRQYQQLHGLASTTVVLTNVYGPRQRPDSGAVAIWTTAMLAAQPTYLYGAGNIRDYLYVGDAVDALVRAADPAVVAHRVNVGAGIQVSDRRLHDAVAVAAGRHVEPIAMPGRLGDLPAMVVDPSSARTVLGWVPQTSLAAGLSATVAHARLRLTLPA